MKLVNVLLIVISFLLFRYIVSTFFVVYKVDQSSMENTLYDGDKILIKKRGKINRNDIILFDQFHITFVKRCIGLPGDTLTILKGKIFINGKVELAKKTIQYKVDSISKTIQILEHFGKRWNLYHWGPTVIPKKGKTIIVNDSNINVYGTLIRSENGLSASVNLKSFIKKSRYRFKNDYFFVVGDNRAHSEDSRTFGFISSSCIIGKSNFVIFSTQNHHRAFVKID